MDSLSEFAPILRAVLALFGVILAACSTRSAFLDFLRARRDKGDDSRQIVGCTVVRDEGFLFGLQILLYVGAIASLLQNVVLTDQEVRRIWWSVSINLLCSGLTFCRLIDRLRVERVPQQST